jgi:hypothetical protein
MCHPEPFDKLRAGSFDFAQGKTQGRLQAES